MTRTPRSSLPSTHRPRRRFGQNFLVDRAVVERLLAAIAPTADDALLEIGPGLGALTWPLLERAGTLTAIEIDRDLAARLRAREACGLDVIEGDALAIDLARIASGRALRVVGNLPYNVGTALVVRLAHEHALLADAHVMLQREVVERLAAAPGTRDWGRLGVLARTVFDVTPLMTVAPGAFSPPPKVHSAVVRLVPRADAPDRATLARLEQATRLAFATRRKTLGRTLRGRLPPARLEALGIDPGARAETLDADAFARLAEALAKG